MFGIGGFELLIILIFGFILVGDRLPDVAKTLGRALRTFRNAQQDMSKVIKEDVFDPDAEDPFKDPLAALDKMGGIAKKTGSSLAGDLNEMAVIAKKKKAAAKTEGMAEEAASAEETAVESVEQAAPVEEAAPVESFAERRARYERERAARLEAQAKEKAAAEAAAAAAAVQAADEAVAAAEAAAPEAPEAGKEEQ